MWLSYFWLIIGWTAYGVLHSILASSDCKDFVARKFKRIYRYYRLIYIIIACITILPLLWLLYLTPGLLLWETGLLSRAFGTVCVTIGSVIMVLSLRTYFSTVHRIRDLVEENFDSVLFQKGLHSHVRHPLYLGTFFMLWGIFLLIPLGSLLVTNIIITIYTLLGIRYEEKKLKAAFGDNYLRYMKEVPMIWPRLGKSTR
jgi:protein-S-isoprenylcysteine O-methyltransferase Ste14